MNQLLMWPNRDVWTMLHLGYRLLAVFPKDSIHVIVIPLLCGGLDTTYNVPCDSACD